MHQMQHTKQGKEMHQDNLFILNKTLYMWSTNFRVGGRTGNAESRRRNFAMSDKYNEWESDDDINMFIKEDYDNVMQEIHNDLQTKFKNFRSGKNPVWNNKNQITHYNRDSHPDHKHTHHADDSIIGSFAYQLKQNREWTYSDTVYLHVCVEHGYNDWARIRIDYPETKDMYKADIKWLDRLHNKIIAMLDAYDFWDK